MNAATADSMPTSMAAAPAVLEISTRGHRQPAAVPILEWPMTIGRAVDADVVLTDPCVAAHHLRISVDDNGTVWVDVLDTRNGARHAGRHYPAGSRFAWRAASPIQLGPVGLELRHASAELPAEQLWHRRSASGWLVLAAGTLALLGVTAFQVWLGIDRPGEWLRELPTALMGVLAVLLLWCGGWALLGKLLSGHAWFGRHLGVAVAGLLAVDVLQQSASVAAFAFSWPMLARFDAVLFAGVAAVAIWAHLRLATRVAPRRLGMAVGVLAAAAVAVPMALNWQQTKRLNNTLYMSELYPPSWRQAPAESVDAFVNNARQLMEPLAQRRADRSDEVQDQVDELDADL
ncbi:FHA domain-containing protein [Ottowia sp.]|uniref:FHA domain-containing protein n=1 Tax=Ottowia sp. TaxID=1898956 RepID=UPI003A8B4122